MATHAYPTEMTPIFVFSFVQNKCGMIPFAYTQNVIHYFLVLCVRQRTLIASLHDENMVYSSMTQHVWFSLLFYDTTCLPFSTPAASECNVEITLYCLSLSKMSVPVIPSDSFNFNTPDSYYLDSSYFKSVKQLLASILQIVINLNPSNTALTSYETDWCYI